MDKIKMDELIQHNWFAVIPAEILLSRKLSSTKKLLIALISNLSNQRGHCFASNEYFAKCLDVSKTSISTLLTELESAGLIKRVIYRNEKKQIIARTLQLKFANPILKNQKTGVLKNPKEKKISFNKAGNIVVKTIKL